MKKKSSIMLYIIVILFVGAYISYNIYLSALGNIDTQYAVSATAYSTVNAECFVVRDESHGDKENNSAIIKNSGNGVYIPYVEDGSRVAAGDTIALFFDSEKDAQAYREKQILTEALAYYTKLQNQSVLSMLDIDKLEKTINDDLINLLTMCENNDFSAVGDIISILKYDISAKKIATGEKIDFSDQIKSIKEQINSISKSASNYKTIKAAFPGCFISNVDGYESAVDYKNVTNMTVGEFNEFYNSAPQKVSSSVIGKIIDEYNWYAVCKVSKASLEQIKKGGRVFASFENTNVSRIEMKVRSVSPVSDGYAVVVLVSDDMSPDIALLRKENIRIFTDEHEGLKVPKEAIRNAEVTGTDDTSDGTQQNKLGVYIIYGNVVKFREINVLYFSDDYAIVEKENDNPNALKLYDMIITKGRNLYDGKIIS